jgi:predicted dehydrogenase
MEETLSIFGESGTVTLGGGSVNRVDRWLFADGNEDMIGCGEYPDTIYGNGHARLYADFLAAIAERRLPLVDTYAGMAALELVLAIYKSHKEGGVVRLPLDNFDCNDMKENKQ